MAAGVLSGSDGEHVGADSVGSSKTADGAVCTTVSKAEREYPEDASSLIDSGVPRMTPEMLRECCIKNQGFAAPELNDCLVLHYKGFRRIENLAPYVNVVTIWLECNGISKIDGLGAMPNVNSLYLQSNVISRIENLEGLTSLKYLNVANNNITHVSGLASIPSLEKINLASNKITEVDALKGLLERPTLQSVDVSQNYIEDGDAYVDFWTKALPDASVLYLHRNPCSRGLKDYRRRMVSSLKQLRWLDDRKVDELERVGCEAWALGGKEAENEAKKNFILQERAEKELSFNNHRRIMQATAERIKAQNAAQAAREAERERAAAEMKETGALKEGWVVVPEKSAAAGAESSRQAELDAKVRAFLDSHPDNSPKEIETAPEGEDIAPQASEPDNLELGEEEEEDQEAEEVLHPEVDATPSCSSGSCNAEERNGGDAQAEEMFVWTSFRDKRLGQLVAQCRYDFRKVAAELSQEFSCCLDATACRQRYGELTKPRKSSADDGTAPACKEQYTGRAKDAPDLDAATVKEVSQWWVRKVSTQRTQEAGPLTQKPLKSSGSQAQQHCNESPDGSEVTHAEDKPDSAATAHTDLAVTVDAGFDKYSQYGDFQYGSTFSPPPRSVASETAPESAAADCPAPLATAMSELLSEPVVTEESAAPALRGIVPTSGAELFELD